MFCTYKQACGLVFHTKSDVIQHRIVIMLTIFSIIKQNLELNKECLFILSLLHVVIVVIGCNFRKLWLLNFFQKIFPLHKTEFTLDSAEWTSRSLLTK